MVGRGSEHCHGCLGGCRVVPCPYRRPMPSREMHSEPFIHLVDVTHDRALIAWGAFQFVRNDHNARWEIVDDEQLQQVAGRHTCIGSSAEPFGDATVEVVNADGDVVASASTDE